MIIGESLCAEWSMSEVGISSPNDLDKPHALVAGNQQQQIYGDLQQISVNLTERIYLKTYIIERVGCITFFEVRTKLNNHI